jgi:hypothetical protein
LSISSPAQDEQVADGMTGTYLAAATSPFSACSTSHGAPEGHPGNAQALFLRAALREFALTSPFFAAFWGAISTILAATPAKTGTGSFFREP